MAVALGLSQHPLAQDFEASTQLHITDGLPALIPLIEHNVALNLLHAPSKVGVETHELALGKELSPKIPKEPDVILAADCAYLEETFPLLVKTLKELMGKARVLWFCYKKRRKRDKECIRLIGKVFSVTQIKGEWERESVFLFKVKQRSQPHE